jgi:hypothetical protein
MRPNPKPIEHSSLTKGQRPDTLIYTGTPKLAYWLQMQRGVKWVSLEQSELLIRLLLNLCRKRTVEIPELLRRMRGKFHTLLLRSRIFVHRLEFSSADVASDLFHEVHTPPSGREVLLHLFVPRVHLLFG